MSNSSQVLALVLLASSVSGLMPDRTHQFHGKPMSAIEEVNHGMKMQYRGQKKVDAWKVSGGKTTALSVVRGRDAKSRSARLQALVEVVNGPDDGHDHCEAAKTAEDCKTAHEAGEKNCIWQSDEKCKDNACGLTPTDDWRLWAGDKAKPEEPTLYCLYDDLLCLGADYKAEAANRDKCYSGGAGGCKGTYYVRQEDGSYRVVELSAESQPGSIGNLWKGESKENPQPCHVCEETEYESAPADKGKTDHVCTPLAGDACAITHYDAGADTSPRTKDRNCQTLSPECNTIHSEPPGDQFEKTPAVPGLHDRVCQALTVCSDTQQADPASNNAVFFLLGQADRDCVEIPSISEVFSAAVLQKCGEKGEGKKAKRKFRRCKGKVKVKIQKAVKKQKKAQKKEQKKERKQKNPKKARKQKKERRQKRR